MSHSYAVQKPNVILGFFLPFLLIDKRILYCLAIIKLAFRLRKVVTQ